MDIKEKSLQLHQEWNGKIEIKSKVKVQSKSDLALVYTPGVAESCMAIKEDPTLVYQLTSKNNLVAVISDGTAVLGLGDIGPLAALPVMEGKCVLFKEFAGINAIPIVLNTKDAKEIIETIERIAPTFGGINLEDISAPRCFEIEEELKKRLSIPVFHDDQHGTAIACYAALKNALRLVKKNIKSVQIVINGAGSAGVAIAKLLLEIGAKNLIICDKQGILFGGDPNLNPFQKELAEKTNPTGCKGTLLEALEGADVFIGVSAGNIVSEAMIRSMNSDAIVFAMANPTPEISREKAIHAGARVYGAGLSNEPNQINNALVFPGIFKGALETRVSNITMEMKIAAATAISDIISDAELHEQHIIPDIFDSRVTEAIVKAIKTLAK